MRERESFKYDFIYIIIVIGGPAVSHGPGPSAVLMWPCLYLVVF